ncbi:acetylcholinesterase-like [Haemaphysalis longicornis]
MKSMFSYGVSSGKYYVGGHCSLQLTILFCLLPSFFASEAPVVKIDSGRVAGERIRVGGTELDAYLGIPYAEPPTGDLRFRKPKPVTPWTGIYNASKKPKPCRQPSVPLVGSLSLNYSDSSEDCLYLNVWTPKPVCPSPGDCERKLPVVVFIHGGGFQWGDSALFFHDPANFVALEGVVFVTFNHRVGLYGFLSLGTPDLPSNAGLWDQNLVLKWVRNNVAAFGGDPDDVTVDGHSSGAISAAIHAGSPHSKGLFKRLILQSGAPLSLVVGEYFRGGKGRLINIAGTLGCYDPKMTLDEQLLDAIGCLRRLTPAEMVHKLEKLDFQQQIFSPVDNDELIPFSVSSPEPWHKLDVKEVLVGTTENEAAVFFHVALMMFPEYTELLTTQYRTLATVVISQTFGASLMNARRIVNAYFGDGEKELEYEEIRDTLSRMLSDAMFNCPAKLFADMISRNGVKTYRYLFAYKPSHSFFPQWMGVAHQEDIMYTLGSLPFLMDKSRYTEPFGSFGKRLLATLDYTPEEEGFMKEVVSAWASFVRTGKPVVPHPNVEWPKYTEDTRRLLVLKPNNYSVIQDPTDEWCQLWKPLFYKSDRTQESRAAPKPTKPAEGDSGKKKAIHPNKSHTRSESSSTTAVIPTFSALLFACVTCLLTSLTLALLKS